MGCKLFGDNQSERTSDDGGIGGYLFICDDFGARMVWIVLQRRSENCGGLVWMIAAYLVEIVRRGGNSHGFQGTRI